MSRIGDDIVGQFDHGRKSAVGTSAVALTGTSRRNARGVQVKAAATNTGTVYVGNSDVTADSADGTDGFPLLPGEGVFVPIDDPSKVFVIASTTNQKVFYLVV